MTDPYRTLVGIGDSELVVDRSRFLGRAEPIETLDEARDIVDALRREHHAARHVCYGLRLGYGDAADGRAHDDGEPSHTGGYPLLQMLIGDDVTDALITVVRYYGGVKLGRGGLKRAYRDAGREALDGAGITTIWPESRLDVAIGYEMVGKLEHLLAELADVRVADKTFAADVTFHLAVRRIDLETVCARLGELLQRPADSFEISEE